MKKVLLPVLGLLFPAFTWAGSFTGKQANELIPGASWVRMQEELPYPQFVQFAPEQELDPATITTWFKSLTKDQGFGLVRYRVEQDALKHEHWSYHITYNGVVLEHASFKAHLKDGKVFRINGEFDLSTPASKSPFINEQQGLQAALATVNAQVYKWEVPQEEEHLKIETGDLSATFFPTGELVYVNEGAEITNPKRLAWRYNVYAQQPLSRANIFVDAQTGSILFTENLIHHADAHGTAVTKYSGSRAIVADSTSPTNFRLREAGRGNGIITLNMQNGTSHGAAVDFIDSDNFWNNVNASQDEVAGDAHWGAEMTYDYLLQQHGRNSINGNGFALYSYVHYDAGYANAFWDGQRMTYGDGDGNITALTALDIAGHEVAHGLTTFSANLIYQNESGALNESFSDIFGASIEHFAKPASANWLIGEDIGSVIRSMENPNAYGDPDCYDGQNWYVGTFDNGGVHINSGVQNFWYYLLVNGGSGTNDLGNSYNVSALGLSDASDVAFRNLTVYLSQSSNYDDARFYGILSAIDLFGGCSPEVGAVTNAWYAVGVGNAYVPYAEADFLTDITTSCTWPATVNFSNLSANGTTFTWDFGDGNTSTQANPSHTYTDTGYFDITLIVDGGANCGIDTLTLANYIHISPNEPCEVVLPSNGTAALQTGCTGRLFDSGGPNGNYSANEFSQITIQPTGAAAVEISFPMFDIEAGSGSTCNFDALYIYDGNSLTSPLIGTYCNTTGNPGTIISSGNAITILFNSDGGAEEAGFVMEWICLQPVDPPVANFSAQTSYACLGEVTFQDQSSNFPDQWQWDFGDGNTSTAQNPVHQYVANGTYNVKLIAANANGVDSTVQSSVVNINLQAGPTSSDAVICVDESATLAATGTGGVVQWFDGLHSTSPVMVGDTFVTPLLVSNQTYYVEEVYPGQVENVGPATNSFGSGNNFNNGQQYLIFDVNQSVVLNSVKVYSGVAGSRTIQWRNSQGVVLEETTVNIPAGEQVVPLNFNLVPGTDYQLGLGTGSQVALYRNNNGASYPYTTSGNEVSIKSSSANSGPLNFYYFFYDWEINQRDCKSDREPVAVTIDDICDVLSVGENAWDGFVNLYPNPAQDRFVVDLMALPQEAVRLQVLSILGQPVQNRTVQAGSVIEVESDQLAKGTYWVVIQGNDYTVRKSVVIH